MAVSIGKMAPTAIVVAAVGYCCWPYLSPSGSNSALTQEAKPPAEINGAMLSPKITAAPGRDPFGMKTEMPAGEKEDGPNPSAKEPPASTTVATALVKGTDEKPQTEPESTIEAGEADSAELTLNATFLHGTRRVAMINSQFYSEGESLEPSGFSIKPFVVAKIFQHRVLLERQGRTVELTYPDPPPKPEVNEHSPLAGRASKPAAPKPARRPT